MSTATTGNAEPARVTRIDNRGRWLPDLQELLRYRRLIGLLGRRDITVRYRQTVLGTLWIFVGPLVSAGLFTFVFGRVADLSSGEVPYFVLSYAGLFTWNLFSGTLTPASTSITGNSALITKIYFPRLVIPLSTLASTLLNTAISFGVMLALIAVAGVGISIQIVLLPVWLLLAIALAMGIGLSFTAVSVWHRDINYLTPLFTQFLLFLSPVAYSLDAVPKNLRDVYLLNPLAAIVEGARWSLLDGSDLPPAWAIGYSVVFALSALFAGLAIFSRSERGFADAI
jgi:lipopolysaccharide transport system permease protein